METNEATYIPPTINPARYLLDESKAREKMQAYLAAKIANAQRTVQNIMTVVPNDRILPAGKLAFDDQDGALRYGISDEAFKDVNEGLHRNAVQQLAGRLGIPVAYVDHLAAAREETEFRTPEGDKVVNRWGLKWLAKTLNVHVAHSSDRYLVRSVGGEARAVLSDKFRRIDCRPSALSLIETAKTNGLVVCDGSFTDTRSTLKFILPRVLEVFPGEWMLFGFDWSNSDYGRGASDIRAFLLRLLCLNGAVGESVVRQIHIGRRLSDDVEYAQETLDADAKASALALRDAAHAATGEGRIQRMIEGIRAANETKINPQNRVESLRRSLNKGEVDQVVQAFNSPDVENMPAGNTLWRWSNAISWVGGQLDDADRRIDFERIAGDVMKPVMPAVKEAA